MLAVADSTRALLESIVAKFNAPIRYAFAYGSGVFEQDGYSDRGTNSGMAPMVDFMFAVTHPEHFHYMNMQQYPAHYPLHARVFGSSYVAKVEDLGPGVWFNAYVPMNGVVSLRPPCHFTASLPFPALLILAFSLMLYHRVRTEVGVGWDKFERLARIPPSIRPFIPATRAKRAHTINLSIIGDQIWSNEH
jgi:hypothetical protein